MIMMQCMVKKLKAIFKGGELLFVMYLEVLSKLSKILAALQHSCITITADYDFYFWLLL